MSAMPERTFSEVARKNFKRLLTYWAQIGAALSLVGAGLGFFSLYAYGEAIGRTDLFIDAIEAKSELLAWMLLIVLMMLAYLFVLSSTTSIFGMTVSLFNKPPEQQRKAAIWLLFPVSAGFGGFVYIVFFHAEDVSSAEAFGIVALIVFLVCMLMYSSSHFRLLVRNALSTNSSYGRPLAKWIFMGFLHLILLMTVFAGSIPATLTLQAYLGDDTPEALPNLAWLTLAMMELTLLPVVIFYWAPGDVYRRLAYGLIALLAMLCVAILISGSMNRIAYSAAGRLDIRDHESARYVLDEDFRLYDLNGTQWKTRLAGLSRVEVEAWQLFSFGDVLLLCPGELSGRELRELRHYTSYCIKTRNSKVIRKPKKPVFPRQEDKRWSCPVPVLVAAGGWWLSPLDGNLF